MKTRLYRAVLGNCELSVFLGLLVLSLTACEALGPRALQAGRNDYNSALNATDVEELLLNIVRVRFNETPYALDVSTISARSEWGATVDAQYEARDPRFGRGTDRQSTNSHYGQYALGGRLSYLERPSIVYQPLRGDKFIREMLSPVDLKSMFLLRFSGWRMSQILRVFARAVNDVPNAPQAGHSRPEGLPQYEEFLEAINAMAELENNGGIIYALVSKSKSVPSSRSVSRSKYQSRDRSAPRDEGTSQDELAIKVLPRARQSPAFLTMTRIFKLDPKAAQYRMKIGWQPEDPRKLVVETRPIISAMFYVGRGVDIPDSVANAGMAHVTLDDNNQPFDWDRVLQGLMKIRSSSSPPSNAYTATRYGEHWYYIDNTDIDSKETLTMLNVVLTLKSSGSYRDPPVLTLPVE